MEDNIDRIQARVNQQYVVEQLMNHGERLANHAEQLKIIAQELKILGEVVVNYNTLLQYQATLNKVLIGVLGRQSFISTEEQGDLAQLNKSLNTLVENCLFETEDFWS
ncbi:MAG: hypothetical protein ACM65M_10640 [Microcoleus sp.]